MDHVGLSDPSTPPTSGRSRRIAGVIGLAVLILAAVIVPLLAWSGPRTRHLWAFASFPPALFGMGYAVALASRARPGAPLLSGLFFRFALGWLALFPTIYGVAIGLTYLLVLFLAGTNAMQDGTALYITIATFITVVVVVLAECGKVMAASAGNNNNRSSRAPWPVWVPSVYTALGLGTAESYYALLALRVAWPDGTLPDSPANLSISILACTCMFTLMEVLASFHMSFGLAAVRTEVRHATRLLPAMLCRSLCIVTVLILPAILNWSAHSGLIAVGVSVGESLCYLLWVTRAEGLRRDSCGDLSSTNEPLIPTTATINVSSEGACSAGATSAT